MSQIRVTLPTSGGINGINVAGFIGGDYLFTKMRCKFMDKRKLNKLYDLVEEIRRECCEKYVLQGAYGTCCYDSGNDKIEFCPFDKDSRCAADNFIEALDIITSKREAIYSYKKSGFMQ